LALNFASMAIFWAVMTVVLIQADLNLEAVLNLKQRVAIVEKIQTNLAKIVYKGATP